MVTPAWRRAAAVWIGAAMGGGIVFGPTGMHPHDLTRLALGVPAVGAGLALTWLLVFTPTARVLVRAEGARYLRSLPGPRWQPLVVGATALVVLQLPWLALWIAGDGVRGLAIVLALTVLIVLVASLRRRPRTAHFPPWTRPFPALRGVYVRALKRRAADALVRGVGLAILAGMVAGLVVRNNGLAGESAAPLGSGAIAIMLVPGWVGALLPLVEAQRSSAWLASSLGITQAMRITVLATVVAGVYLVGTAIALGAAGVTFAMSPWLAATAIVTSLGMSLVATRALLVADRDVASAPVRVVSGAVVASALAVVCLAWLGILGALVLVGIGICAVLAVRPA